MHLKVKRKKDSTQLVVSLASSPLVIRSPEFLEGEALSVPSMGTTETHRNIQISRHDCMINFVINQVFFPSKNFWCGFF